MPLRPRHWIPLLLLGAALVSSHAQSLRWAARGDAQTMDPHAAAETVTNNLAQLVHDALVERDREMRIVPALATEWALVEPTRWRFTLRRGVKFHDGSTFSADDVVFSIERAQQPSSQFAVFARPLGTPVKIDEHTVELRQAQPNPVLLEQLSSVMIMSRAWARAHGAERVPDFRAREEGHSSFHANGTGRYRLLERAPAVRTMLARNPAWWGQFEGNVEQVRYLPIANDATRTAALIAGDIDFMQDVPPQDEPRIAATPDLRLVSGLENRLIFLAFDQWRDELLYADVRGRNPFKDARVREAFTRAIDTRALAGAIMRGQAQPTGCMATAPIGCMARELESPAPPDPARARALLAEAGYPDGLRLTMDCPNDRYVNDRAICVALVGMLARVGVALKVDDRSKSQYFPKIQSGDASFFMQGWGGSAVDPQIVMDNFFHSQDRARQKGGENNGRVADAELDRWVAAAATETDPSTRERLIAQAQRRVAERFYYLPLHRQHLVWAARSNVQPVATPNNIVRVDWIRIR